MSLVGISPDGGRVAYAVWGPRSASDTDVLTSAIAVLDLATGRVTTLDATRFGRNAVFGRQSIFRSMTWSAIYRSPTWSADGTRIVFMRTRFGPGAIVDGEQQYDVLTVDDDGRNLRAIAPPDAPSTQWGPWFTWDGRVVFIRWTEPGRHRGDAWVADADGGNPMQLDVTIPTLTAAGCMICPYPVSAGADPLAVRTTHPFEEFFITTMYWQPSRASQP
jgi:hypothetical protein